MSARLFAFVCLSQFALCSSLPGPVAPKKQSLVVFLKGSDAQDQLTLLSMREEVQKLLAPIGYSVEFRTKLNGPVSGHLVVTEFKGQCTSGVESFGPERLDLATTTVQNGHVLPFSQVHCPVVSRLLTSSLENAPAGLRQSLFGRSLGRILAHEFFHILADECGHQNEGIAKSHFSARELLSPHFSFEEGALERMASTVSPIDAPRRGSSE